MTSLSRFTVFTTQTDGTCIYQALQEATAARPRRRVEIVNLGLDPAEALEMGLPIEPVNRKAGKVPVAHYVDSQWRQWLQKNRIELNAMGTPMLLKWLDGKMSKAAGKLIPPPAILTEYLFDRTRALIRQSLTDDAIAAARTSKSEPKQPQPPSGQPSTK